MIHQISNSNLSQPDGGRTTAGGGAVIGGRPLGIVTKNSSPSQLAPAEFDLSTGEILSTPRDPSKVRSERWALKSIVDRLLPASRTSKCMVLRAPVRNNGLMPIELLKGRKHNKAFYHGLMACGDVWNCPICNAKIAERRRQELIQALDEARKQGLSIHLVTLTIPHGIGDDINDMLSRLKKALNVMSSGKRSLKNEALKFGDGVHFAGYIRALEVTYGKNGFHPHFHILQFVDRERLSDGCWAHIDSSVIEYLYKKAWKRACASAGLPEPSDTYGCTAQNGSEAARYVTKWGLEDELTKNISKTGKFHGLTPWGLLRAILDDDSSVIEPVRAENVFRIYSNAFKGKRQLHWSVGLRKRLLPKNVELTDLELAEQAEDERTDIMSGITPEQWKVIRRFRKQSDLQNAAEMVDTDYGRSAVKALLDFIMTLSERCNDASSKSKKGVSERRGREPPAEGPANE
jgi:hypothetical protein